MSRDPALPTGTVTFLFTDIEGSTGLVTRFGDDYASLLATHARLLRSAIVSHGGTEVSTEGDAFFAVFPSAPAAIGAVVEAQRTLSAERWPEDGAVRVRMGLHTGEGRLGGDDYVGIDVHRAARIAAAGHGGQVLVSEATGSLVRGALPDGVALRDLGSHRLKDLPELEHLWQLDMEGLRAEFPALRALDAVTAHLPTQVSSFVGRSEVEAVKGLLDSARLVTLTGPGGTGKTRLSIQVAGEIAYRFPDGTWFVALDAVTDSGLVASEIASTLRLSAGSGPPIEQVIAHLGGRRVLLVLDNLEQVIDAAADVGRIIRECPDVSILTTSRIRLHVYGEHEFPVPPLALPPTDGSLDLERASAFEAVRLFLERAAAVRPDFRLEESDVPVVADIVARLDGLPLAIELAAARVRSLPVAALRDRLDSRLSVLTGGARDLPQRQRTLRAAIEWSHELLDEPDRRLFARFSVMSGGSRLAEAESVCGADMEVGRDVFDGLESLTEQSLVVARPGPDSDLRYLMLATIREYAGERLDGSGEAGDIRRRHAEAYLALAEEAAPQLLGADGAAWNDRLEVEHDNLRAALDWIVETDLAELGLRLIAALWRFWQIRGHLIEGQHRSEAVLELPSVADQPAGVRSRAESAAGGISYWRQDPARTHAHYSAALRLARGTGERALLAQALYDAGFAATPDDVPLLERYRLGRPHFEEGLALYRELGDKGGIASCLWALAFGRAAERDLEGALELATQSLELSRELGDPFRTGWAAHLVGVTSMVLGRHETAAGLLAESLAIWTAAGDKSGIALLLVDAAMLAEARGRLEPRWRLAGAADRLRIETGTELIHTQVEFLDWHADLQPESDEERAWWEAGRSSQLDDAVELARTELAEQG